MASHDTRADLVLGKAEFAAAEFQAEGHVFVDAHVGIKGVVLEDHGNVAVFGGDVVDDLIADFDGAAGYFFEAGDHAQSR